MKISLKIVLTAAVLLPMMFDFGTVSQRKYVPMHFIAGVNGERILADVDALLNSAPTKWSEIKDQSELESNDVSDAPTASAQALTAPGTNGSGGPSPFPSPFPLPSPVPRTGFGKIWDNTAMLFGASPDGIGIATTFAMHKTSDNSALFVSNYHAVEKFCNVGEQIENDMDTDESGKYPCSALSVIHDVAIDMVANHTAIDGKDPWKSSVDSLLYFDKRRDIAVFRISLPQGNLITEPTFEMDYDSKLEILRQQALERVTAKVDPKAKKSKKKNEADKMPVEAFEMFLVAVWTPEAQPVDSTTTAPTTNVPQLIQKRWFRGYIQGIETFEGSKEMGFVRGLKHSIITQPGSSGGPMTLSDGRILGINTAVELNVFYAKAGCSSKQIESHKASYGMPSSILKPVFNSPFFNSISQNQEPSHEN